MKEIIIAIIISLTIGLVAFLALGKYQDMIWASNKANQIKAVNECMNTAKLEIKEELGISQQFDNKLYKLCMQDKGYPTSLK